MTIEFFMDAACTDKAASWNKDSGNFSVTYSEDGRHMTVDITKAGLGEINGVTANKNGKLYTGYSNYTARVTYSAVINSDKSFVYGEKGNENTVMAGKYLAPRKSTPGCRPKGGDPIRDKRRKIITISLAVLFFLLALGLTVYPIFSSRYNEAHQSQIHTEYQDAVQALPDTAIPEARAKAQAYNEELWSSIVRYGRQSLIG